MRSVCLIFCPTFLAIVSILCNRATADDVAFDAGTDSAYDGGWLQDSNGGHGWGGWSPMAFGASGAKYFIGIPPTGGQRSWGLNGGQFDIATASRQLGVPLQIGQTLSVDIYNGAPAQGQGRVVWNLDPDITQGGYNDIFQTTAVAGHSTYLLQTGNGSLDTGVVVNNTGMRFALTIGAQNTCNSR